MERADLSLRGPRTTAAWFAALLVVTATAGAAVIDVPPPAFDNPPSPWVSQWDQPVISYAFKTSWDGITWTEDQKAVVRGAIAELDAAMPNQVFQETGDFTLRFAGSDFFRDWRDSGQYNDPGWDLSTPLAVAYKHNNGPWDPAKYPNNEIYINTAYPWSYSLTGVEPGRFDFWSVILHEAIHMLACDAHATHSNEVMFATISPGERKYLQESDYDILRAAGYTIPEPAGMVILATAVGLLVRRREAGRAAENDA